MLPLGIVQQGPRWIGTKEEVGMTWSEWRAALGTDWIFQISGIFILLETNISPEKSILKMIFLFPRWDMLVSRRVFFLLYRWSLLSHHCPGFFGRPCTKSIRTGKRVLKFWILDISILHSVGKARGICIRWPVLKLWRMLSFAWSFAICGKPIPFPASHHHHAIYAYLYALDMMWNRRDASLWLLFGGSCNNK